MLTALAYLIPITTMCCIITAILQMKKLKFRDRDSPKVIQPANSGVTF